MRRGSPRRNSALLQSGVQLRRGHGSGGSAQAVPQFLMELVLHSTDLQAGHIGDGGNSVLAVGQFTEAVLCDTHAVQAITGKDLFQLITGFAIELRIRIIIRIINKRK